MKLFNSIFMSYPDNTDAPPVLDIKDAELEDVDLEFDLLFPDKVSGQDSNYSNDDTC